MKITLRIWLTALIIQPIIFAFYMQKDALIIIPFELIGSLPGIIVFGLMLNAVASMQLPLPVKWIWISLAALALATCCSLIVVGVFDLPIRQSIGLMAPAPIAASMAILINAVALNKKMKNEPPELTDPESAIFNI